MHIYNIIKHKTKSPHFDLTLHLPLVTFTSGMEYSISKTDESIYKTGMEQVYHIFQQVSLRKSFIL